MRIGIFTDTYEPDINGVVSSIVTLENALKKLGHEVFVITNHNRLHIEMVGNVLYLPGVELKQLYGYTLSSFYSFKGKKMIEGMHLDLIHVHTEFGVGLFARVIAKLLKIPLVATYHTSYEDYTHYVNFFNSEVVEKYSKKAVGKLSKLYANSAKAIIAPSLKTKETLLNYGVKCPIYQIPTGLHLSRFQEIDQHYVEGVRTTYQFNENDKVALFVGRIAEEKNIIMLLDAMVFVDDIRLMIVGDGPQLNAIQQYAKQIGVNDKVIFTSRKENQLVPQYYALSNCFVSASTSETQGMTYIEALAAGKVVFARRDEVVKDLIQEGKNGYFFDDAKELAEKLKHFFTLDQAKIDTMYANCMDSVHQYDDIVFGEKVVAMYEDVLGEKMEIIDIRFEKEGICLIFEEDELLVDMDTYLNHHLAKGKVVSQQLYTQLKHQYEQVHAYQKVVKQVSKKMYTEKEIETMLQEAGVEEVAFYLKKMKENHLYNDDDYVEAFLNQTKIQYDSNRKIMDTLNKKGIEIELERDENAVALAYANKLSRTSNHIPLLAKKQKIRQKLYQDQFGFDAIAYALENVEIESDMDKEALLYQNAYEKAERLYAKYEGYEKERRIQLYLKTKGFKQYDD